jgi:hypothetical protein
MERKKRKMEKKITNKHFKLNFENLPLFSFQIYKA